MPNTDERLREGIEYFEQMLKVMPEDRQTLEFLAVAYPQIGEVEKAEITVAQLARVLLKEGDIETAEALLPRLEECTHPDAKAMVIRINAAKAPSPELVPEAPRADTIFSMACESEARLAEKLGDSEVAQQMSALPDNGRMFLISALSLIDRDRPEACEHAIADLADEYGLVPIPLDAYEPVKEAIVQLPLELVRLRGIIPFAKMGDAWLVAFLSPHDEHLKQTVTAALGGNVRFYLAEPRLVESALTKLFPDGQPKN